MRLIRFSTIAALFACALASPLAAQKIRGTLRDSASAGPIPGAVVTLLDSAGTVLGRNISDERGSFRVAYAHVARLMRVVRIGFQPLAIPLADSLARVASLNLTMVPFSTKLASVHVLDKSNCPARADRATAFAYWEQARAGLLNTVVARESHPMTVHRLGFERTFDGNTDDITRFLVWEDSASNSATSFNAVHSARDFVSAGFSTVNPDSTTVMFGPDADVLLADAFASGYCFRVAAPSRARPTQIGLAFAPPYRRPGRVDIDGILWLDTIARSLRDIEFKYVGLPAGTDGYRPGGSISFHTMANGVSFIDRWYLRRVDALQDTLPDFTFRSFLYASENGGELAHAKWPDGQSWNASLGSLHIRTAWSSGKPAVGATVLLPGTPYRGTADSSGSILIGDLLPGPYSVRINDKHTEQLGFTLPTKLRFIAARDSVRQATLSVPTTEEYVAGLCQKSKQWAYGDSTFILGRVVNAAGKPVADARVTFAYWSIALNTWFFTKWYYTTGTDGVFELCSTLFTPGMKLLVRTSQDGHHEDTVRDVSSNLTIVPVTTKGAP